MSTLHVCNKYRQADKYTVHSMSATITQLLKAEAYRLGFSYCGVARAGFLEEEAPRLEAWLAQGRHGTMAWMANHFDKRLDPRLLVEGARSVVSLLYNYAPQPGTGQPTDAGYKVSCYAWGQDYHTVVKTKLFALLNYLRAQAGDVQGRAFVDSAPVMDKAWARRAGAGWIGKHTNLIRPRAGSYFFIAELIVDIDLVADGPVKDYCGTCTRCIDACPTDALTPYQLDANPLHILPHDRVARGHPHPLCRPNGGLGVWL